MSTQDPVSEDLILYPDSYQAQIAGQWPVLAGTAWHFYLQRGRGLIYYGEPHLETDTLSYLTIEDAQWPEEINAKLEKYDPQTQIVFFLQWPEEWVVWIATGDPSPPEAYRLAGFTEDPDLGA